MESYQSILRKASFSNIYGVLAKYTWMHLLTFTNRIDKGSGVNNFKNGFQQHLWLIPVILYSYLYTYCVEACLYSLTSRWKEIAEP